MTEDRFEYEVIGGKAGKTLAMHTATHGRRTVMIERKMIAVIIVAMMVRLPYTALRNGIFVHPTTTQGLNDPISGIER